MVRVAELYSREEITHQAGAQIPWRTLIEITYKCETKEARLWYINKVFENSWNRSILLKQIKAKAYERNTIEPIVSKGIKEYDNPLIKEIIKELYYMPFSSEEINNEKDLKDNIINGILDFLKELGKGFALVDREYKLKYKGKIYYLDLLFYNYLLHAFVVIEIKIGEYKVEHLGQLKNYVKMVDLTLKDEVSKPTIGILLCRDVNEVIVKTTIVDEITPIVLSKYLLVDEIKKYIK